MIARSTSAISSLVAPAASARPALPCRQTPDDAMATDTATCSGATVLTSSAGVWHRPGPNPSLGEPFVEDRQSARGFLASRRLAHVPPMPSHKYTSREGGFHYPVGLNRGLQLSRSPRSRARMTA